jgi:hypothetical protein
MSWVEGGQARERPGWLNANLQELRRQNMGEIPFSPSLLLLFEIPFPPSTVFMLIPITGMLMVVAIVAIVYWHKSRQRELQAHQEMRIREMEHHRKMKELELEIEKAKASQRVG